VVDGLAAWHKAVAGVAGEISTTPVRCRYRPGATDDWAERLGIVVRQKLLHATCALPTVSYHAMTNIADTITTPVLSTFVYVVQGHRVAAKFEIKADQRSDVNMLPELPVLIFNPDHDRRGRRFRVVVIEAENDVVAMNKLRDKFKELVMLDAS